MVSTTAGLVPVHRRHHSFEEMNGEALVFRHPAKRGIYLNETAAVIWRLCDGNRSVDDIIAELAAIYPADASGIADDVRDAVDRLVELGAVKFIDPAQGAPPSDLSDGVLPPSALKQALP